MPNPTVSRPLTPLYKVFLFGRFRIERRDPQGCYHSLPPDTWDRQSPRRVLTYLLLAPGRHSLKDPLLDVLCPDDELDRAQAVLSQALSLIRRRLVDEQGNPLLLPRKATPEKPLVLAGREIWCDWDEFQQTLMQAQAAEQQGKEALPVWEQAYALCQEEFLLEERYNDWCREVRERAEGDQRLCLLRLAACYRQQGRSVEAERLLRAWLSSHALDQDVLCRLMEVLAEQGRVQEALAWYQRVKAALDEEEMEVTEHTQALARSLQVNSFSSLQSAFVVQTQQRHSSLEGSQEHATELARPAHKSSQPQSTSTINLTDEQLAVPALPAADRTPFTQHDLLQRFAHTFGSKQVDQGLMHVLETRTEHYWGIRHTATPAAHDLWSYVSVHLHTMLSLLEGSLFPEQRRAVCAQLARSAMLAGVLAYDAGKQTAARSWYRYAGSAAMEAEQPELQAITDGWTCFTWLYTKEYDQARSAIERATKLSRESGDLYLLAWLKATEAEIAVHLHQNSACLDSLKQVEQLSEMPPRPEYLSLFNLNMTQVLGYKGICLQQLYRKEAPATCGFLREAEASLLQAVAAPTSARRLITYLCDLASVYARQNEIEQAAATIACSFTFLGEVPEKTAERRVVGVRTLLQHASDLPAVQALDEQIAVLFPPDERMRE